MSKIETDNRQKNKKHGTFSNVALVIWDILTAALSYFLAISLVGDSDAPYYYSSEVGRIIAVMLGIGILVVFFNTVCGCYNRILRNIGFNDIVRLILPICFDVIALGAADVVIRFVFDNVKNTSGKELNIGYFHPKVYIIFGLLLVFFSVIGRCFVRLINSFKAAVKTKNSDLSPIIVYGAGEAGNYFLKMISGHPDMNMKAVAAIDDDQSIKGRKICGVPVIGGFDKLEAAIVKNNAQQVIVAIPTASRDLLNNIIGVCKKHRCQIKRFGTIDNAAENVEKMSVSEINLEDLLHRDRVNLNMDVVEKFVKDKVVIVTGGAGSIGSEICRQVLKFGCKKLCIFDIHENGLFDIDNELKQLYPDRFEVRLGSIRDRVRLTEVFDEFQPSIVFHAAAHKHVPMMEINPMEAIKNNVMGTINTCQVAIMHKVQKFILISTDKAVNPTNIMGASKRITELVIQLMDKISDTEFAAVRFGNVLGSNGSVVPFFRKQIEKGGPVTVTHPEMRRYFMTIPEACQLVLEAGSMAKGGEIFVLDMGQPVYIKDLAMDLIRLSGYEPDVDIKITYTGLRPGEKLFEEISMADEDVDRTSNEKITINKPVYYDEQFVAQTIKDIEEAIANENVQKMFELVKVLVPTFNHKK